ncbi:Proteasomal ubiquitin receptor ADRM1 [Sciurus carolinensis]|uniref:Proteasomal ubiquitin receptor ADRM1 n=1 Tax=Sciurus carolinensis TaxID=30640 RepID=A0AA41MYP8_SCICA|nr:Proteasomal ubiquitin receptor ADRM1 [Sciurus carolinensis]
MSLKGTTITLDKRKGLIYIRQTDDSLIHFCWKDGTSGTVEDNLIIFPDDCELKHVPQFGLPAEAVEATNKGDVEAFAKAMQSNAGSKQKEGDAKDKKDEEEDMSLD